MCRRKIQLAKGVYSSLMCLLYCIMSYLYKLMFSFVQSFLPNGTLHVGKHKSPCQITCCTLTDSCFSLGQYLLKFSRHFVVEAGNFIVAGEACWLIMHRGSGTGVEGYIDFLDHGYKLQRGCLHPQLISVTPTTDN